VLRILPLSAVGCLAVARRGSRYENQELRSKDDRIDNGTGGDVTDHKMAQIRWEICYLGPCYCTFQVYSGLFPNPFHAMPIRSAQCLYGFLTTLFLLGRVSAARVRVSVSAVGAALSHTISPEDPSKVGENWMKMSRCSPIACKAVPLILSVTHFLGSLHAWLEYKADIHYQIRRRRATFSYQTIFLKR
jgi:hypothetical protein